MKGGPEEIRALLRRLDGRGYKAYKDLREAWDFPGFVLHVDHVQGDPFAAPSRLCVEMSLERASIPLTFVETRLRRTALGDSLTRTFQRAVGSTVTAFRVSRGSRLASGQHE